MGAALTQDEMGNSLTISLKPAMCVTWLHFIEITAIMFNTHFLLDNNNGQLVRVRQKYWGQNQSGKEKNKCICVCENREHKVENTDPDSMNTHHTTKLPTLMSATGALLVAALLASEDELLWRDKSQDLNTGQQLRVGYTHIY